MSGHEGFLAILDELRALHLKKCADYGTGEDPFANIRASARLGIEPWKGALLRAADKDARIEAFVANGSLKNESLEDSLLDRTAYTIIALALRREKIE